MVLALPRVFFSHWRDKTHMEIDARSLCLLNLATDQILNYFNPELHFLSYILKARHLNKTKPEYNIS
jgi:hypothetical protein